MTFQETIRSLASKFGIGGFEAEDGNVALSIDGMDALLADGGSGMLVATGYLGVPPPDGQLEFANMLLDANIDLKDTRDAAFARNPETGYMSSWSASRWTKSDSTRFAKGSANS